MTLQLKICVLVLFSLLSKAWADPVNPQDCDYQIQSSWTLPKELKETSGLAYDKVQGGLYQINDSGNESAIWKSDLKGNNLQKISLLDVKNVDFEDLSMGHCPGKSDEECFFVADIGDNMQSRRDDKIHTIHILDFKLLSSSLTIKPKISIPLIYPDRIHNAESFAVHPQYPYAYILTKDYDGLLFRSVIPPKLFRIDLGAVTNGRPTLLTEVGTIDLGALAGSDIALATAMEFSPDGEWLYILTYKNIVAIKNTGWANLSAPFPVAWERNQNFVVIKIEEQKQMEALTFISKDQFMVTSEGKNEKAIIYNCHPKVLPPQ